MNTKIFSLITKNLHQAFALDKYDAVRDAIGPKTRVDQLPWTPARYRKFKDAVEQELNIASEFNGTIEDVVKDLDVQYTGRFFGEIWKPKTETFSYTGWQLVDEINKLKPNRVLDVGCGYNQFKGRVNNLIGIDPYNNMSDYQVDILEFVDAPQSYDVIMALGSINFNCYTDIEERVAACVTLLAPKGKFFLRVNPGEQHEKGPWVDVFHWDFKVVQEFAKKFNLILETFKKDNNNRLYVVYAKN
jgi:SAM-dependent methyltransferase